MATQSVIEMQRRLKAGREYLSALRRLGFNPDALLWAGVGGTKDESVMELLVVTSWADNIGPKAIYDLLFEAYDASATPKEIDPFVVSLFSPHTQIAIDLEGALRAIKRKPLDSGNPFIALGMLDYFTIPKWIISHRRSQTTRFDDARRFATFQSNVQKLAA